MYGEYAKYSMQLCIQPQVSKDDAAMICMLVGLAHTGLVLPGAAPRPSRARVRMAEGGGSLDPTLDLIVTRGLDTLEDAWLLARRISAPQVNALDSMAAWEDDRDSRPRLLVMGSGWAAHGKGLRARGQGARGLGG